MTRSTPATDPLVEALAIRLAADRRVGGEARALVRGLRLLLALKLEDGPTGVGELANLGGLSLDAAYPAIHRLRGRGYLHEDQRRYSLSELGQELVATLDAAHRQGIQAYVDQVNSAERRQLEAAFGIVQSSG
jgi:DNA-binding MarR family transcriptional regulator